MKVRAGAVAVIGVVLGIALAIGIPSFQNARQRGHQKKTMGDMRTLATAIESYSIDAVVYPTLAASSDAEMDALERMLVPTYVKEMPRRDAWGNSLRIVSTAKEYTITSVAKDRKPDSEAPHHVESNGGTTDFGADLIFATGSFVQFPDSGGC